MALGSGDKILAATSDDCGKTSAKLARVKELPSYASDSLRLEWAGIPLERPVMRYSLVPADWQLSAGDESNTVASPVHLCDAENHLKIR